MLIKKIIVCFVLIAVSAISVSAVESSDISAKSAVVINAQTGEVVFEKNAHEKRSMASTTKIMTALIAAQSGRIYQSVKITQQMCGAEGTSIGLKPDYEITLYNLICGMLLESGNDAANAVAIYLAGSTEKFAEMMNEKAKEIGMTQTNFVTASGLDDKNHYSTAYDMALLGAYAVKNPIIKSICSSKSKQIDFQKPDITVTYTNHNRLLDLYEGAYGIKTGFTKKSGRCLVSAACRNNIDLIAVTLNAPDDWNDHKKILDYAFSSLKSEKIYLQVPKSISVIGSVQNKIEISTEKYPLTLSYLNESKITQKVFLPPFVYAPVQSGDVIGCVKIYQDDKYISKVNIYACQSCDSIEETYVKKTSIFDKLRKMFIKEE